MKEDIELLQSIYKNSKMGVIGIENILEEVKDKDLLKTIKEQRNDYYSICTKTIKLLASANAEKESVSKMTELMTFMDAKLKIIKDNSTNNIAKMMIEGNHTGIIEITERLHNYKGDNKKIIKLANHLLEIENRNLENLKKYL